MKRIAILIEDLFNERAYISLLQVVEEGYEVHLMGQGYCLYCKIGLTEKSTCF